MSNGRRSWAHLFGEAVLIVISILLAFGIDAWWEGRSIEQERTRYLQALVADFSVNATDAWGITQGAGTVVAVVDSGKATGTTTPVDNTNISSYRWKHAQATCDCAFHSDPGSDVRLELRPGGRRLPGRDPPLLARVGESIITTLGGVRPDARMSTNRVAARAPGLCGNRRRPHVDLGDPQRQAPPRRTIRALTVSWEIRRALPRAAQG